MKKLLIATHNSAKLEEIKKYLSDIAYELVSLDDVGIVEDVEEDKNTFKENAIKKAKFYCKKSGLSVLADDGGIEIDYLNGRPGVFSKRWVGKDQSDKSIISHTLKQLEGVPIKKRGAQMHLVMALAFPDGAVYTAEGLVRGVIALKRHATVNTNGFPYRALFYFPKLGKYYNHIDMTKQDEEKLNHRRKALIKLKKYL